MLTVAVVVALVSGLGLVLGWAAHHYRAENPLAHLHEDEAPVETDKLKCACCWIQRIV